MSECSCNKSLSMRRRRRRAISKPIKLRRYRQQRTNHPSIQTIVVILITFFLEVWIPVVIEAAQVFSTESMERVHERLDEFMSVPAQQVARIKKYREVDGFPHHMTAADRDMVFTILYTECAAAYDAGIPALVYIGLDDGTLFYVYQDLVLTDYREPGECGYNITETEDPSNKYHDYLYSCVNDTTGEPIQCILPEKDKYIECINDCELIPCSVDDLMLSTTSNGNNDTLPNNNIDNATTTTTTTATTTIWCRNYVVKEIEVGSGVQLGYVPDTTYCLNKHGKNEQRPGYVLKNYSEPEQLDSCYYKDGTTLVNRSITGSFAACSSDSPNSTCNNVFNGGFYSYNYDPRYRDWYISTKQYQRDVWTAPYTFVGLDNVIGITYSEPIYKVQDSSSDKQIFAGVIAVDYDLRSISEYLLNHYADSDKRILIIEQTDPYYIIASSVRDSLVTKIVLIEDGKTPCPLNMTHDDSVCTPARIAINELETMGSAQVVDDNSTITPDLYDNNTILFRAFTAQQNISFPTNSTVNFKVADPIGSPAYVSQLRPYSISNNLDWYVMVIVPMDRSTTDAALPGDPMFVVICLLGLVGFFGCFILLLQFYSKRTERAVIHSDWKFTCAFIGGCTALNVSTFTLLGANTDATCMLRMWSFNGLFVCALSPLFVKVWRMAKLLTAPSGFQRSQVNNVQAFLYTLPLVITEIIILAIFSIVDPPRQTESLGVGYGIGVQEVTCTQQTKAFVVTQLVYDAVLVFIGCVLAYNSRDLDPKFGEAKQLAFAMYNIAFTGIIILAIVNLVEMEQVSVLTLQGVGILWGSFFCSLAFVLPRLLEVNREHRAYRLSFNSTVSNNNSPALTSASNAAAALAEANYRRKKQSPVPEAPRNVASPQMDSVKSQINNIGNDRRKLSTNIINNGNSRISFPFTTWETSIKVSSGASDLQSVVSQPFQLTDKETSTDNDKDDSRLHQSLSNGKSGKYVSSVGIAIEQVLNDSTTNNLGNDQWINSDILSKKMDVTDSNGSG